MGQCAHFIGDHRKTPPGFPGPGRFDGGIERQQVGLLGDGANHVQYLADFPGLLGQGLNLLQGRAGVGAHGLDRVQCFDDSRLALTGLLRRLARAVRCRDGIACDFFHGHRHLIHGGGGLFDFIVLL